MKALHIKKHVHFESKDKDMRLGMYLRYRKGIFEFSGAKFLITSQWYDLNKENFENRLKNINKRGQK